MKIPKSINVFGKKYKIKIVDNPPYAGLCDPIGEIFVSSNQTEEQIVKTIIHEVTHAWQFRVGLDQAVSRETLEIMSEGVSTFIWEIFEVKFKNTTKSKS
jgi:hypothetical protein